MPNIMKDIITEKQTHTHNLFPAMPQKYQEIKRKYIVNQQG